MESILIYEHPLSPYAQKVKIALYEKGLAFELRTPDGMGTGVVEDDFIASSPRMEVPSFVQGEIKIFDSTVILEYIEEAYPEPPLLPASPVERARVRMLEDTVDTHIEAILWGLAEIRYFGRAEGALATAIEAAAAKQISGWYAWLTSELGSGEWFNGEAFGWGDLSVVPYVNGLVGYGFPADGKLLDWLSRANARDSVRQCQAAAAEAAFDGPNMDMSALKAAVASGLFKREYRDHRLEWMIKSGGLEVVAAGLENDNIRFTKVFG
ncbi:MAG: glutathione S-transferase/RNA polymerase-associated protein [Candidatus Azotimanducaceae bacterium]|jgi:glutathione S-transferase